MTFPRVQRYVVFAVVVALLAGCAHHYGEVTSHAPYGFFSGIWHGFVAPYALLANILSGFASLFGLSLFSSVEIIGRPNTGLFFYYVGFLFGLSSYSSVATH